MAGGHINPAVTFGLFLARKVSFNRALYYIICQCLGAICGAGIVKGFQPNFYETAGGGANSVAHGYTKGDGLGAEIVGTFVLVYVVFAATDAKRKARDSHVPVSSSLPLSLSTNEEYSLLISALLVSQFPLMARIFSCYRCADMMLPLAGAYAASHRICGLSGALGNYSHHWNEYQSRAFTGRSHYLQQTA